MYFVYVLYSKSIDKFYIGFTNNLKRRVSEHKSKNVYTSKRMPGCKLVYYEASLFKKDAQRREKQLKTGFGRSYLRKRIKDYIADVAQW
ncbi:MAG: GIY-YIG nuclease family protein [Candidatus Aenigmarchaeota archaeon]|nr:GIY-YIG nuclease family protein [Candidatus Aenigmarchaeota archaeon]